ncbi:MAG: HEAT repeat domain-containing protein [Pirellulales bacterium]
MVSSNCAGTGSRIWWWVVLCIALFPASLLDAQNTPGRPATKPGATGQNSANASAGKPAPVPQWIWGGDVQRIQAPQSCYFRHAFNYGQQDEACQLEIAADDEFAVFVNGRMAGRGEGWRDWHTVNLTRFVRRGENTLAIEVRNASGKTAGLAARLTMRRPAGNQVVLVTDNSWRVSLEGLPNWNQVRMTGDQWAPAAVLGPFGGGPPGTPASANVSLGAEGIKPLSVSRKTDAKFRLPREFRLEHLADHASVGSLIAMTFNEFGQMIVSQENGPLVVCLQNSSGVYDRWQVLAEQMKNCQGLLCLNGDVYAVGTGPDGGGLYRLRDTDQDGVMDDTKRLLELSDRMLEHGPHAITLGPDGLLYVLLGNHTQIPASVEKQSAYRNTYEGDLVQPRWSDPGGHADGIQAPGGVVIRLDVDASRVEVMCGGLRNPYDIAFTDDGELLTHDADMESDMATTWYRPTRVLHLVDGGEYGWRSGWAKWPEYYLDSLPSIASTGRGSPAGSVAYHHHAFPSRYRGAFFLADWSEGRVLLARLNREGAGYAAETQPFMEGEPLNVTDLDVGPDGALYLITGGRGTSGNIYRVSWRGKPEPDAEVGSLGAGVRAVLQQPQPESAWARQQIATLQAELGDRWEDLIETVCLSSSQPVKDRARALRLLKLYGPEPTADLLLTIVEDKDAQLRGEAVFYLGCLHDEDTRVNESLVQHLRDDDAWVRRRACEALAKRQASVTWDHLAKLLESDDRWESFAARRLLEAQPVETWREQVLTTDNCRLFNQGALALVIAQPGDEHARQIIEHGRTLMDGFVSDRDFVDLLRVFQLALHRSKLDADATAELKDQLAQEFPATDRMINRELVRLLAHLQVDSISDRYLEYLSSDLPVEDRVHTAMYLARITTGWTPAQRLDLMHYLEIPENAGNSVPGYLQRVSLQFGQSIPESQFAEILEKGDQHPAAALAVALRLKAPLKDQQLNWLKQLDQKIAPEDAERFKRLKVAILAVLARDGSDVSMAYIREVYQRDPGRRVEAAVGLAQRPAGANWPLLVKAVPLLDGPIAQEVLVKLRGVKQVPEEADAYRQVILCGLRLGESGAKDAIALLEHWQGYDASTKEEIPWDRALRAWQAWFRKTYPTEPPATLMVSGQDSKWDYDALLKHLTRAENRQQASAERGAAIFKSARCAECHRCGDIGEPMGPDLSAVSRRFLTKEILDSVLYPSKVISDQYAAKTVTTTKGQTYTGLVSQTATELTVLTPDGRKTRIPLDEVEETQPSPVSAMPEGLLNGLHLDEVTDLFEYLQSAADRRTAARP